MADILRELHGESQNAPLSAQQTISVISFLHDLHQDQVRQINELRTRVMQNFTGVDSLRSDLALSGSQFRVLEQGLRETQGQVGAVKEDINVNSERMIRLRECANAAQEGIEQLRAGLKVTNTNVQCMREEQNDHSEKIGKLRRDLDRGAKGQLTQLEGKVGQALLRVQNLESGFELCKMKQLEHKDSLQTLDVSVGAAAFSISHLSAASSEQANEIATVGGKLDKTTVNLEMTNAVVMKIHGEVTANKAETLALRDDHRALDARHDMLYGDYSETSQQSNAGSEAIERLCAEQISTRNALQEGLGDVFKLQNGWKQQTRSLEDLNEKIDRLDLRVRSTQENLAVTNALALPNLKSEGLMSPSMGGAAGGSQPQSARSARSSQAANAKRKEAAWIQRNIGCVPDRMGWM